MSASLARFLRHQAFFYAFCSAVSAMSAAPTAALAIQTTPVISSTGVHYANLHFADIGATYDFAEILGFTPAECAISPDEILGLERGFEYFWQVLGNDYRAQRPIDIFVVPYSEADSNASAFSFPDSDLTELALAWMGSKPKSQYQAYISVNNTLPDTVWDNSELKILPSNGIDSDLPGTMMHELFHAFGLSLFTDIDDTGQVAIKKSDLTQYTKHLYDVYDRSIETIASYTDKDFIPIVALDASESRPDLSTLDPGAIYVDYKNLSSGMYFRGKNVDEVLDGALLAWPIEVWGDSENTSDPVPGLPINGFEAIGYQGYEPYYEGSHIELQNSLMSHQVYRNWMILMEAELALLQDIGFDFDRKRFYGYSLYADGRTLENHNGYWARNEDGTDWIKGLASTQDWGIGLHIYGSKNKVTQRADLMTEGSYAIGARVDGSENQLTIASGTTVKADGFGGKGILFSWGKNHELAIESGASVSALGEGGIALAFDFGSNELGDQFGYYGSYTADVYDDSFGWYAQNEIPDVLKGPLISELRIQGRVEGDMASIYISPNAFVKNIVIESGAQLKGDIISLWDMEKTLYGCDHTGMQSNDRLVTTLTFGSALQSAALREPSSSSEIVFNDLIWGPKGLTIEVNDTHLHFGGVATVLGVAIEPNATVEGGRYLLMPTSYSTPLFDNKGRVISTVLNPVSISGDYHQADNASLTLTVHDGHFVPMSVDGTAKFEEGSAIVATAEGGWMPDGHVTVDKDSPIIIDAESLSAENLTYHYLSASELPVSPTLVISDDTEGWVVNRAPNAYSRYAQGDAKKIARIFDTSAAQAVTDETKELFAYLDWSDSNGSAINEAAAALTGDGLIDMVASAIALQRLAQSASESKLSIAQGDGDYAWVNPFGATASAAMAGHSRMDVAGLAGGWVKKSGDTQSSLSLVALNSDGKSAHARELNAQGLWIAGSWEKSHLNQSNAFIQTSAHLGYINAEEKRTVHFGNFYDSIEADPQYWSFGLSAITGLKFKVLDSITIAPYAGLSGFALYMPSFKEDSAGIADLSVDSSVFHSLEAQLGVKFEGAVFEPNKAYWQMKLAYGRQILSDAGGLDLSFNQKDLSGSFDRRAQWDSKNRIKAGLKVGIEAQNGLSLNALIQSEWESSDSHSLAGGLEATWRF